MHIDVHYTVMLIFEYMQVDNYRINALQMVLTCRQYVHVQLGGCIRRDVQAMGRTA